MMKTLRGEKQIIAIKERCEICGKVLRCISVSKYHTGIYPWNEISYVCQDCINDAFERTEKENEHAIHTQ